MSHQLLGLGQELDATATDTQIGFEQQLLITHTSLAEAHLFLALHSLTDEHRINGPHMKLLFAVWKL
jgi:hypothetical protein